MIYQNFHHIYCNYILKDNLVVALGGRVAEEIIFGKEKISNGAGGDIQQITSIARSMIMRFGTVSYTHLTLPTILLV